MTAVVRWPTAPLDAVARLRVVAAGLPGAVLVERVLAAPFDAVWAIAGDLEGGVPRFESSVDSIRILSREGDRLRVESRGPLGRTRFDAELRSGWCLMRTRFIDIGMAAAPEGEGRTRFAHFEGLRFGGRLLRPLIRRSVETDLRALAALVERAEG